MATGRTGAQTLQQQRAAYAMGEVTRLLGNEQKSREEFKTCATSLPAMIRMNGLGQAAAYCHSQSGRWPEMYELLSGWLIQPGQPYAGKSKLLTGIIECDMHAYRIAQAEALLLLDWVKKFAKAQVRESTP